MVLRVRSFNGFTQLSTVDLIYLSTNQSFSIYAGQQQVAEFPQYRILRKFLQLLKFSKRSYTA